MPFSLSHPAIILPLRKFPKYFSLTGLIIGSMSPDLEYFLRMRIISRHGHTLEGLIWMDIPLSLLFIFVFHNLVRNTFIDNSHIFLKSRFFDYRNFDWNSYFKKNWIIVITLF